MRFEILTSKTIPEIDGWFDDPATQKYVGDKNWLGKAPVRFKEAIGKNFRGATVLDRVGYVFYQDDQPVGYIEAEVYDKLCVVESVSGRVEVKHEENVVSAGIVYVVSPEHRGQGIAKQMLLEFIKLPRFNKVKVFVAGTEEENAASMHLLESIGFIKKNEIPDFEEMINWELRL